MTRVFIALVVAVASLFVISSGQAQQRLSIGIVAYQIVLNRSNAVTSIRNQVQAELKAIRQEMDRLEQQFRDRDSELDRQASVMSADAMTQARQSFEENLSQARSSILQRQRSVEQANLVALQKVERKITDIVTRLAQERGYNLVLDGSAVLIMDPAMDISQNVLEALDAELPSVSVRIEQ